MFKFSLISKFILSLPSYYGPFKVGYKDVEWIELTEPEEDPTLLRLYYPTQTLGIKSDWTMLSSQCISLTECSTTFILHF